MLRNIFYAKSILSRMGDTTMSKRDYRSYNILGDEMKKEIITQENEGIVIVGAIDEEVNNNVTVDSKIEDALEDIHVEDRQSIDMSVEIKDKEQANQSNSKFVSASRKRRHFDKINTTLERMGTSRVKSTKIQVDQSNHVEEQSDNKKNPEIIQVGQNYKENYTAYSTEDLKQENIESDTTFSNYKSSYHNKKRSRLAKWSMFTFKFILIMMLLPFIFILGAGILMFLGCFILGIIGLIGAGIYLIGLTSFYSTQISEMLIALGITSSITMLSLGAILFILLIMMIRKANELIQKYRKTKKVNSNRESI